MFRDRLRSPGATFAAEGGWLAALARYAPALAHPASQLLGQAWPLWLGAALFAVYVAWSFSQLGRAARLIAGLAPMGLLVLLAASHEPVAHVEAALHPTLFLVTFLTVFDLLRRVASRSPLVAAAGREILSQPPGRRYVAVSLGSMALSIVLLLGVVGLVGSMAMAGASGRPDLARRQMLIAMTRGYQLMPAWSPISMPFAVVATAFPMVDWIQIVAMTVPLCVLMWLLGWLGRERTAASAHSARSAAGRADALMRLGALLAGLLAAIFAVSWIVGVRVIDAVLLVVPALAAVWWLALVRSGRGLKASPGDTVRRAGDNELVIVCGAAWLAGAAAPLIPPELFAQSITEGLIPLWAVPPAIVVIVMLLGQIAAPPVFAVLLFAAALPDPAVAGLSPDLVAAACLATWGVAAIVSPFNPVTLTLERITGVPSREIAHRWNGRYGIAAALLLAVLLGVLAR